MKETYLEKLEYTNVIKNLSDYCNTTLGKSLSLSLKPSSNIGDVKKSLEETSEAVSVIYKAGNPPINEIIDNNDSLKV